MVPQEKSDVVAIFVPQGLKIDVISKWISMSSFK